MLAGLIVLVIGSGMAIIAYHEAYGGSVTSTSFTNYSGNQWVSKDLNVTNGSAISAIGNGSGFYLVETSELSSINETNLAKQAINPTANLSIAGKTDKEYFNLSGSYTIVYFGPKDPAILYQVIPSSGNVVGFGFLLIVGGVLAFAGIIVIIVGAVLRRKI